MTDQTLSCQDPIWEEAWAWVQRQHETGFDDASFNVQLNQWLQTDPAHRKAYGKVARIWSVAGLVPPVHDIDIPLPDCSNPAGDGASPAGERT